MKCRKCDINLADPIDRVKHQDRLWSARDVSCDTWCTKYQNQMARLVVLSSPSISEAIIKCKQSPDAAKTKFLICAKIDVDKMTNEQPIVRKISHFDMITMLTMYDVENEINTKSTLGLVLSDYSDYRKPLITPFSYSTNFTP